MSDVVDEAGKIEEAIRDRAIAEARERARKPPLRSTRCLQCGAPTAGGARWCGPDCRDDFERAGGEA